MVFCATITIDRPVDVVWQQLLQLDAYPRWYPGLVSIRGELIEQGRLHMALSLGARTLRPTVEITTLQPQQALIWQGSVFGRSPLRKLFSITRRFELEAIDATRTRFSNHEVFSGPIGICVGTLLQSRLQPRYALLNQGFKHWCEMAPTAP